MEALAPLYAVVTHGYLAGRGHEALHVFQHRIRRGEQQFSLEHLGAFGADLATLSSFFDVPWATVGPSLQADDHLFLFHAVGECLSALGRVFEAEEPLQHALTLAHKQAHWTRAARAALTLSEVYRARGDLTTALDFAEKSVAYVRHPGVPAKVQVLSHTFLGFALYWVGQFEAARATFQTAEQVQQSANPARPLLHSVLGYMYCELLLDELESRAGRLAPPDFAQEWHALHKRVAQALTWAEDDGLPCDIGLQHVSMGRVYEQELDNLRRKDFLRGAETAEISVRLGNYSASYFEGSAYAILAWQPHGATPGTGGGTTDDATGEAMSALAIAAARPVTPQEQALMHCTRAVEYLRRSNHRNYLPRGLLTRAALYRLQNQLDLAHHDLQEALDIAQSSAMVFYQVDAYLEQAILHLAASRLAPHQDHVH
jgi:tetratricopeptide (TPR) repeat protein